MRADLQAGHGFALLDPHGDLAQAVADATPAWRIEAGVIYLDPSDLAFPIGFNSLYDVTPDQSALVAARVVAAFKHIWGDSWGPRLEYILTNALRLLLDAPGSTLLGLPRLHDDEGRRRDQALGFQDAIDTGLGYEGFLGICEGDSHLARRKLWLFECPLDDLVAHLVGDAVPDALRPWLAIFERVEAAGCIAIEPCVEGRLGDTDLVERAPDRQVRGLDGADDLELLGCGISHAISSPSAITLFLSSRFSRVTSASASLS